jgi:hypothetical protein
VSRSSMEKNNQSLDKEPSFQKLHKLSQQEQGDVVVSKVVEKVTMMTKPGTGIDTPSHQQILIVIAATLSTLADLK